MRDAAAVASGWRRDDGRENKTAAAAAAPDLRFAVRWVARVRVARAARRGVSCPAPVARAGSLGAGVDSTKTKTKTKKSRRPTGREGRRDGAKQHHAPATA